MKTLLLGASDNPERYAYKATIALRKNGHEVVSIGRKPVTVADVTAATNWEQADLKDIDTVTLYLSPANQKPYYTILTELNPRRVIFNPGTENTELKELLEAKGVLCYEACTLVLLSIGNY